MPITDQLLGKLIGNCERHWSVLAGWEFF